MGRALSASDFIAVTLGESMGGFVMVRLCVQSVCGVATRNIVAINARSTSLADTSLTVDVFRKRAQRTIDDEARGRSSYESSRKSIHQASTKK